MTTSTTFGQRLRVLREAAGLSCRALDAVAGLHFNHVAALERADSCQTTTARKLAEALGCTVGWLVAAEGEPPAAEAVRAAVAKARPEQPADVDAQPVAAEG